MKNCLLIILCLIPFYELMAQAEFRQGYIISHQGDTTWGSLSFAASTQPKFKAVGSEKSVTYRAGEIAAYGFDQDRHFRSLPVVLPGDDELTQQAFLEVLVSGELSLFRYKDIFFLSNDDTEFTPVLDQGRVETVEGKRVVVGSKKHIGILQYYLKDCPSQHEKAKTVSLKESSLVPLVVAYNQCVSGAFEEFKTTKSWLKVSPGFSLGMVASHLNFTALQGDNYRTYYLTEPDFSVSYSPAVGLMLDVSAPRMSDRVFFQTGLIYYKSSYTGHSSRETTLSTEHNKVDISMNELTLPLGARFTFPTKTHSPYVSIGVANSFFLRTHSHRKVDREFQTSTYSSEGRALRMKEMQSNIWAAAGSSKDLSNNWEAFVEARFTYSGGFTYEIFNPFDEPSLVPRFTYLALLIGIRL